MASQPDDDFSFDLLNCLRSALPATRLTYAEPPARITGGFDTLIYGFRLAGGPEDWSAPLILRLFREGNPWITLSGSERARFETAVQNTVRSLGYPAPLVLYSCLDTEPLGAPFLIMERLPGGIMLDLLFRPSPFIFRVPELLADYHVRLHSLDPQVVLRAVEKEGIPTRVLTVADWLEQVEQLIADAQLDGLTLGVRWLLDNRPGHPGKPVVCHGDFHPLNILIANGDISGVIDWPWVRIAPAEYDVGATIAIFTQGPVELPGLLQGVVNWGRRRIVNRYLAAYRRRRPLDEDALRYYEAVRLLGFLFEAGQQRQADAGVIARPEKPTAFAAERTVRGITARFQEITRVGVAIPSTQAR